MRYKIEVSMNPDFKANPNCPYFWIIRNIVEDNDNNDWCTVNSGWARTSMEAWVKAYQFWDDIASL